MIGITVTGVKVDSFAKGTLVMVCAEELTAIDTLRDNLAEHMEISREEATKMIIESLHSTLSVEE